MSSAEDQAVSRRYQDYVIREGRFVGRFEEMYRNSAEIPWHQDETVNAIFSDITVAIVRRCRPSSLLDVGCGLGFMAERLRREVPGLERVVGLDISETAIAKAAEMFPKIEFRAGTLFDAAVPVGEFDVVVSKDVLWYVLGDLVGYLARLVKASRRYAYIGQSFPERRPFYGDDVLPDAASLLALADRCGYRVHYSAIERDCHYGGREYAHLLIEAMP